MSAPIRRLSASAGTCVFVKQSLGPVLCGPSTLRGQAASRSRAPLLPKLRGQLAEFLDEGSSVRLGALTPAHRCRFAVRAPAASLGAFLGGRARRGRAPSRGHSPSPLGSSRPRISLRPLPTGLDAASPSPRRAYLPRHPVAQTAPGGTGILTRCPSLCGRCRINLGPTDPTLTAMA